MHPNEFPIPLRIDFDPVTSELGSILDNRPQTVDNLRASRDDRLCGGVLRRSGGSGKIEGDVFRLVTYGRRLNERMNGQQYKWRDSVITVFRPVG